MMKNLNWERNIQNICLAGLAIASLSGCEAIGNYLTLDRAKTWYEKKCDTFEDYMQAGAEFASKGDFDKAIQRYKDGRSLAQSLYGSDDGRIATSSAALARLEEQGNKLADAEADYKAALAIDKKILGWTSSDTIQVRRDLARVLLLRYKEDEAKQITAGLKDAPVPSHATHHSRHK